MDSNQSDEGRLREPIAKTYEAVMAIFDDPATEQKKVLADILTRNAKVEYLLHCNLDHGAPESDAIRKSFKENVPVSDYDDYKPFIDRILKGEKAPLLAPDPVSEIWTSSGTSNGVPKMFAATDESMSHRAQRTQENTAIVKRLLPEIGTFKTLEFKFIRASTTIGVGLPCHPLSTAAFTSPPFGTAWRGKSNTTSPPEVALSKDHTASMYCHLLLGLAQRDKVGRIACSFPTIFIRAMRRLEEWWPELCDDIANGCLSPRVTDENLRPIVLSMLEKDFSLAELLRQEFSASDCWNSNGMVQKLWPNTKMVDTICTGSMASYFPIVTTFTGKVPVINSGTYGSTESFLGVNLNPRAAANQTCYTLHPQAAYFEFLPVADSNAGSNRVELGSDAREVVDLMSLKEGEEYEILVTTIAGLYRFKIGDVLKVVGFHKSNPTVQLMRRRNVVLSVDTDKTDESELQAAVTKASQVLKLELGSTRVMDYTSTVDYSSKPGHYVVFWELAKDPAMDSNSPSGGSAWLPWQSESQFEVQSALEKCCAAMEAELGRIYRRGRHENVVGALELRVVQRGTFELLFRDAVARGASTNQFKIPRGMAAQSPGLKILNARVFQSVVSQEKPPFNPGTMEASGELAELRCSLCRVITD